VIRPQQSIEMHNRASRPGCRISTRTDLAHLGH
jgi:hypothetical protein